MGISHILICDTSVATDYVNKPHLKAGEHGSCRLPAQESRDLQLVFLG